MVDQKKKEEDKKANGIAPPFDPFGITPQFYIKGENSTVTWVGFFCTVLQVVITIVVIVLYTIDYVNKKGSNLTILNLKSEESSLFDLHDAQ